MQRVIALGFFDGVHLGHAALLQATTRRAQQLGVRAAALTFDVPPEAKITARQLPLVCTVGDRCEIMRDEFGMGDIILLTFTDDLMAMPWQDFLPQLLVRDYGAVGVVAGYDFTFGRYGEGTVDKLQAQCAQLGLSCDIVPCVTHNGATVSSTMIRNLLAQGAVDRAASFLGRPYSIELPVKHGRGLGRNLGFPTVNMAFPSSLQAPAAGVYRSVVLLDGTAMPAITNVGRRPTVGSDSELTVETHLYDFNGDLYGKTLRVQLLQFMRPERAFDTVEQLKTQVLADLEAGRQRPV